MKKTIKIIALLVTVLLGGNINAQNSPYMKFRKPTTSDNITYRFAHVISGVDAYVTVIGNRNASVDAIDDSSAHKYAWQPFIRFGRTNNSNDTSYVDFRITFKNHSNNTNNTQSKVSMTVVDLDGNGLGSYRELVATSLPSTPKGILGSTISSITSLLKNTFISSIVTFPNIDTTNYIAMTQIDFNNVNTFTVRTGVVGRIGSSTTRQFSFYFKGFNTMNFILPVKLIDFKANSTESSNVISWKTTSEENASKFEVYKSLDGINYTIVDEVKAVGFSQTVQSYSLVDSDKSESNTYYRLKLIDNDGTFCWSNTIVIASASISNTTVQSVYPNPSKGNLNVTLSNDSENSFKVEITDMFGKVYRTVNSEDISNESQISFDLSDLSNGIYFVKVTVENCESNITKFIKD